MYKITLFDKRGNPREVEVTGTEDLSKAASPSNHNDGAITNLNGTREIEDQKRSLQAR